MKFLGGFLKFLSILLMLIGAAACAICCFQGVQYDDSNLYWAGASVFLGFLLVALCTWGIGSALIQTAKLKKRVAQLEQRLWNTLPVEPVVPATSGTAVQPAVENNVPAETPAEAIAPTGKFPKQWLPIAIAVAAVIVVLLVVLIVVIAGGKDKDADIEAPTHHQSEVAPTLSPDGTAPEVPEPTEDPENPKNSEAEELNCSPSSGQ